MSCSKFESDVALYAGGDLPAGQIAPIESHLAECADCRALLEDLRMDIAALAAWRDDPQEDAILVELSGAGFSLRGALAPLLAIAAALLIAALLMWPRHHQPKVEIVHVSPRLRVAPPEPAQPSRPASVRRVRHHRRPTPAAEPGPPLLVQFVTNDPNIVIYWLIDQKPQGD